MRHDQSSKDLSIQNEHLNQLRLIHIFQQKLADLLTYHNFVLTNYLNTDPINFDDQWNSLLLQADFIKPYICDVSKKLHELNDSGKRLLFEGAQGALLDIDS